MWKSLTAVTRQVYTCVVRPSISSGKNQIHIYTYILFRFYLFADGELQSAKPLLILLLVVNHQAVCHMSDGQQNTTKDEQRVPNAKDWRYDMH